MCTRLHPGLSPEFAFTVGGETKPGAVTREHLDAMAAELRMRPQVIARRARELAEGVPAAVEQALHTVSPSLSPGAKVLAARLKRFVLSSTTRTVARVGR